MAAANPALTGMWIPVAGASVAVRSRSWSGTPEIYFDKQIDNSRLVKVADGQRNRELGMFVTSVAVLFLLVMVYAWQHFSAVEYGYKIESLDAQRQTLSEAHRALLLEQASLSDPGRIDAFARKMGLEAPQPGQMQRLEPGSDAGQPVLARANEIAVVTAGP